MEFITVTAKQYRDMISPQKNNKYNAVKTESDGIVFDSKFEANKWEELKMLERIGVIKDLQRQVRFVLQDAYVNNQGKKIKPITYIADFCYTKDGQKIVMDTKSPATRTPAYLLKKKLFEYKNQDYLFIECEK